MGHFFFCHFLSEIAQKQEGGEREGRKDRAGSWIRVVKMSKGHFKARIG